MSKNGNTVYYYVNNIVREDSLDDWRGAEHSHDNQFVFGIPFLQENPEALAHSYINVTLAEYTDRDKNNSRFVMDLWTNFAKFGLVYPYIKFF